MGQPVLTFFPVDNGDMSLVRLGDPRQTAILIDCKIRGAADDPADSTRDVASDLRQRLSRNAQGRPFVDVFMLSHPDQDHCSGLRNHFWLGAPEDYPDDGKPEAEKRIVIEEIWSSPMVFRRACRARPLCDDARAFHAEARRRVALNRARTFTNIEPGNRIVVLGEDQDGKTDDLGPILVKADEHVRQVNGAPNAYVDAHLLAPRAPSDDETEEALSKNQSSVVINFHLAVDPGVTDACAFLTGGDADVLVWERLWERYGSTPAVLAYDLLLAPHHCSWHSLSWDSWSAYREQAKVSPGARAALGQAKQGAFVVASSKPVEDDNSDPPCIRAKREYGQILSAHDGKFFCTGEYPSRRWPAPLEFRVSRYGPSELRTTGSTAAAMTTQRSG